jgi:hypothetical protein
MDWPQALMSIPPNSIPCSARLLVSFPHQRDGLVILATVAGATLWPELMEDRER